MKQIIQDMLRTELNIIRKIILLTDIADDNSQIIFFHPSKQDTTGTEFLTKGHLTVIVIRIITDLTEQDISFCLMLI